MCADPSPISLHATGGPQQQQPAVGVDWGLVSEVLGAVRADGFSLGGMTALR
jgi:hypothetical protein